MPCTIEHKDDHVAVMTMNTNKVNAQSPAFFEDLHAAFDHLVATARSFSGIGAVLWAGLDFDQGGDEGIEALGPLRIMRRGDICELFAVQRPDRAQRQRHDLSNLRLAEDIVICANGNTMQRVEPTRR